MTRIWLCGHLPLFTLLFVASAAMPTTSQAASLSESIGQLQSVGKGGAGNSDAAKAWQAIVKSGPEALPELLGSLEDASPLAANWIRSAIDAIAERSLGDDVKLPNADLERIVLDTRRNPRARRLAYEWLVRADKTTPGRLLPDMLGDPSVELRRDAVARVESAAKESSNKTQAKQLYQQAFAAAVDKDQVEALAKSLKEYGIEVSLPDHFGFVMRWDLVGPFDNSDEKGFAVAFAPEKAVALDAKYTGKLADKKIGWFAHTTKNNYGTVDFNTAIAKENGVTSYATTTFVSDKAQKVQFRITSRNSIKLWVNGSLIDSREFYHSGESFDQYISTAQLKKGENRLLLKVCQNEQTEDWAQTWQFQLRVCDATGSAVLASNRANGSQ